MRGKQLLATAAIVISTVPICVPAAQATRWNIIIGGRSGEHLAGTRGEDLIGGRGGDDSIRPRRGSDIVRAGPGDDYIALFNDGSLDRIHCGDGFDVVSYHFSVDQHDIIDPNCEGVVA